MIPVVAEDPAAPSAFADAGQLDVVYRDRKKSRAPSWKEPSRNALG